MATAENYVTHPLNDEPYFVDLPNLKWLYTDNEVAIEKQPANMGSGQ